MLLFLSLDSYRGTTQLRGGILYLVAVLVTSHRLPNSLFRGSPGDVCCSAGKLSSSGCPTLHCAQPLSNSSQGAARQPCAWAEPAMHSQHRSHGLSRIMWGFTQAHMLRCRFGALLYGVIQHYNKRKTRWPTGLHALARCLPCSHHTPSALCRPCCTRRAQPAGAVQVVVKVSSSGPVLKTNP